MIFGGGMVANYVVVGQVLHMSNTLWALILPLVRFLVQRNDFPHLLPHHHSGLHH